MESVIQFLSENIVLVGATVVVGLLIIFTIFRVLGGASSGRSSAMSTREQVRKVWSADIDLTNESLAEILNLTKEMYALTEDKTSSAPGVLDDFMFTSTLGTESPIAVITKKVLLGDNYSSLPYNSNTITSLSNMIAPLIEEDDLVSVVQEATQRFPSTETPSTLIKGLKEYLSTLQENACCIVGIWKVIRPQVIVPVAFVLNERLGALGDVCLADVDHPFKWKIEVDATKRTAGTIDGDSGEIFVRHHRRDAVMVNGKKEAELEWTLSLTFDNTISYPHTISADVTEIHVTEQSDEKFVDELERVVLKLL